MTARMSANSPLAKARTFSGPEGRHGRRTARPSRPPQAPIQAGDICTSPKSTWPTGRRDRSRRSDGRRSVAFHGRRDGTSKGRGLIFSAIERGATQAQIWFLPYPKGAAQKITNDLNDYRDLSLTDDSTALITVQAETLVNVWLSPNADGVNAGRDRQITDGIGQNNGVGGLTWLPDGRVVYVSRAYGSQDIWLMDQDGKNQRQLTTAETRIDRYSGGHPQTDATSSSSRRARAIQTSIATS